MVEKIIPVSNVYELYNNLKQKQEQRKKNKPKFTPPPNDAG